MKPITIFGSIVHVHAWSIANAFAGILVLTIMANCLRQTLFKDSNKPPVVFHWLPFIGSTVTYGIDPFKFFFQCQAKVRLYDPQNVFDGINT